MVLVPAQFYVAPSSSAQKLMAALTSFRWGVMLYQMSCGKLPFEGDSMAQLMFRIANEPHPDIRKFNPALPDTLVAVIDKALTKDPAMRYQTGAEMAKDVRACLASLGGDDAAKSA